jgi:segregation and condensation protein A
MTDAIGGGGGADAIPNATGAAEDDESVQPVEVLVGLAEDGEIDPWDIDIVAVTDKFLDRLDAADLSASGRALFYASVLLRMKSDALIDDGEEEPDAPADDDPWNAPAPVAGDASAGGAGDPVAQLEAEMDRRLDRKRARGTPETLDELVRELRDHERGAWWKESREYDTSGEGSRGPQTLDYSAPAASGPGDDRAPISPTAAVSEVAHEEDMEGTIAAVRGALDEQYDRGRSEVLFAEIRDAGGSPVETFLGLLFLAHRGGVSLDQDEFFGDLWIRDPGATAGASEAVAD